MSREPELRARERRMTLVAGLLAVAASVAGMVGFRLLAPAPEPAANLPKATAAQHAAHDVAPPPPERTHPLSGRVLDDDGDPIEGATLAAQCGPYPAITTRSRADGGFLLEALPEGSCLLKAEAPHHESTVMPELDLPAAIPGRLQITLARASGVEGRVIGLDGSPAANATVTLAGSGVWPPREAGSDAEGSFRFGDIPPGVYELQARLGNAVSDPAEGIDARPAEPTFVTLSLSAGSALEVIVIDAKSTKPIAGAAISLVEHGLLAAPRRIESATDGTAAWQGLRPATHRIVVEAEGYVPHASLQVPQAERLRIMLDAAATISGTVVDPDGNPVAGAELELLSAASTAPAASQLGFAAGDNLGVTLGSVPKIPLGQDRPLSLLPALAGPAGLAGASTARAEGFRSDSGGRFRLGPVPAGSVRVLARRVGFAPGQSEPLRVAAGATVEGVRVTLSRGGRIAGVVVDDDGQPRVAARVDLALADDLLGRSTVTGPSGGFVFDTVLGRGTLTASAAGLAPAIQTVQVAAGAEVEITLVLAGEAVELAGDVAGARGEPLADAVVRVTGCGTAATLSRTAVTGAQGSFVIDGLPKTACTLEIEHPDHVPIELEAVPGGATLAIQMRRGLRLQAELRDPYSHEPVRGARASLSGQERKLRAHSSTQGRIEFSGINPGNYELSISHPLHVMQTIRVVVTGDEPTTDLGVLELLPAGSAAGDVVDGFGSVVAGAVVSAGDPPDFRVGVRSASDGSFRLGGLAPGRSLLQARAPDGQLSAAVEARTRPGETVGGVVLRFREGVQASQDAEPAPHRQAEQAAEEQELAKPREGVAVELEYAAGAVRIGRVLGTAATRAGLRSGDVLQSVDGEPVLAVAQGRSLLRGPAGSQARLSLVRGAQQLTVRTARERYLP